MKVDGLCATIGAAVAGKGSKNYLILLERGRALAGRSFVTERRLLDEIVRSLHVVCGGLVLALGCFALAARKGGTWHRFVGRAYVVFMLATCASAFWLALDTQSSFLVALSVFTAYLAFSGFRIVRLRARAVRRPGAIDWLVTLSLTSASVVLAIQSFVIVDGHLRLRVVPLVFATIGTVLAVLDLVRFIRRGARITGLPRHVVHMVSSFIAAVTAFSVINFTFLPPLARWLWPTVVGTVAITLLVRRLENAPDRSTGA